jgi:ribosomal protein S18 acetylase RimI-like enzyme
VVEVRPLSTHDQLLEATGGDVFVRWQVRADVPLEAWQVGDAVAFVRTRQTGRRQLTVLGEPPDAAAAVHAVVARSASAVAQGVTVPYGTLPLLANSIRVGPGDDWDWMWVDAARLALAVDDARVRRLAPDDTGDVVRLLASASARHSSDPGDPDVVSWFGIRDDDGRLVACAAHTESVPGTPHLASIATDPDARGRGLGTALTATVCRRLLDEGARVVTLGMYADNDVARRLYARIGFACSHRWSSRAVVVRP